MADFEFQGELSVDGISAGIFTFEIEIVSRVEDDPVTLETRLLTRTLARWPDGRELYEVFRILPEDQVLSD